MVTALTEPPLACDHVDTAPRQPLIDPSSAQLRRIRGGLRLLCGPLRGRGSRELASLLAAVEAEHALDHGRAEDGEEHLPSIRSRASRKASSALTIWSDTCFCNRRNGLSRSTGWRIAFTSEARFSTPFISGFVLAKIV